MRQYCDIDDVNYIYTERVWLEKEIKLKEFNFKVLHGILPCNKNLKQWRIRMSDCCDVCGEIQTIEHLLWNCRYVRSLWKVERADGTTILDEMQRGLSSAPPFYSLIHFVSADFQMDEKLALEVKKFGGLEELRCFSAQVGQIAFLDRNSCFIYYTVVKETYESIPTMQALESCLRSVRDHCLENQVKFLAIGRPNDLNWHEVRALLIDMFYDTPIRIAVYMGYSRKSFYSSMLV